MRKRVLKLNSGLVYLENGDFRLLKKANPSFTEDNLQFFFEELAVSFITESEFRCFSLDVQYNFIRCSCILGLIAIKSEPTVMNVYGYTVSITHTDTVKKNVVLCLNGVPLLSAIEDWENPGISWDIDYLNPCLANYMDESHILEAVIHAYNG